MILSEALMERDARIHSLLLKPPVDGELDMLETFESSLHDDLEQ